MCSWYAVLGECEEAAEVDSQAHISLDMRTCALCGASKPLDHFDPRFIHKGTKVTCAECRQERDAPWRAAMERERAERGAREAEDHAWWAASGFLRGAQVGGAALRCDAPCYIYALADPRTHHMYYVGRTQDVQRRFRGHISFRPVSGTAYTRKLLNVGEEPRLLILETTYPCCGIDAQWSEWDELTADSPHDMTGLTICT